MLSISESVSPAESKKLLGCAFQHPDEFGVEDHERGGVVGVEHVINTGDSVPIHQVPGVSFAVR